jgi:hypothetical protein
MGIVIVVDVVVAEGYREAAKSSHMSVGQKTSPSWVLGPPVCSLSSSWLVLVTKSLVVLVVVDIVVVAIVAEVDVRTKVIDEPLELMWSRKVK